MCEVMILLLSLWHKLSLISGGQQYNTSIPSYIIISIVAQFSSLLRRSIVKVQDYHILNQPRSLSCRSMLRPSAWRASMTCFRCFLRRACCIVRFTPCPGYATRPREPKFEVLASIRTISPPRVSITRYERSHLS